MEGKQELTARLIGENRYIIKDDAHVCCYLVIGKERAALIDTGLGRQDLLKKVRELTDKPVIVLCTHAHVDHIGGTYQFEELCITAGDRRMVESFYLTENRVRMAADLREAGIPEEMIGEWIRFSLPRIREISDGEVIDLGGIRLETVSVPGHTAGSVVFFDRAARLVYSGDAMTRYLLDNCEECSPFETLLDSLKRLKTVMGDTEYSYGGHIHAQPDPASYLDVMIRDLESIASGEKKGEPFTHNMFGSATRYVFDEWIFLGAPEKE